ncbi:hypothetical protein OIU74_007438 [Salix koriyanagi]|uniref:Uncharacterized protein n=1 Tax=Salix koriyanagi TaxID=2511006 RepID=A0A9Q0U3P3_9ROSI|nr:hypothetical protein OIU74_007438 [Salix koriyanagi]
MTDLQTETIIVNDPRVRIVEIGLARTTAMDQILIPDLNQEEIITTIKLKVLKIKDIAVVPHHLEKGLVLEIKQKVRQSSLSFN